MMKLKIDRLAKIEGLRYLTLTILRPYMVLEITVVHYLMIANFSSDKGDLSVKLSILFIHLYLYVTTWLTYP